MVSTIGVKNDGKVHVYDSMYSSVTVGTYTKKQIASILCTEQSRIELHTMDVRLQAGGSDCGLFAIAFATAIVNGVPPDKFIFDQANMRQHLYQCLQSGKLQMFPTLSNEEAPLELRPRTNIDVLCLCRMPELQGIEMVECCQCKE